MSQLILTFESPSPINMEKLTKQNKRLYDYLLTGNSIHCFSRARRELKIGYLNSRISDLINVHDIKIKKKRIRVKDVDGELVNVVEYKLNI